MDADFLRQLQDRGRFFYERFPGAAAAEEWTRMRDKAEQDCAARTRRSTDGAVVVTQKSEHPHRSVMLRVKASTTI